MKRFKIAAIIIIAVFVVFLTSSHFILKQLLKEFSSVGFWENPTFKSPSVTSRDYVLNLSHKIEAPLQCIPFLTILGEIPICVHDYPYEYITQYIRKSRIWERESSKILQNMLVNNPGYGVVDIGANLGMFGLLAANLQRPVLAVEAMDINIKKFHQSIVINRFDKYITLVTRPLSDRYETIRLAAAITNLGMSRLVQSSRYQDIVGGQLYYENKTTLLLDDLINLMPRKKAIMIIDVEGNEGKVIRGGQKFFDAINISHVFMECNLLSRIHRGFLVDFFSKRGYKPYSTTSFKSELVLAESTPWPINVFWKKMNKK